MIQLMILLNYQRKLNSMGINKRNIMRKIAMEIKKNQLALDKLETLLKQISLYQIDPNTRIYRGRTLLHYAILANNCAALT